MQLEKEDVKSSHACFLSLQTQNEMTPENGEMLVDLAAQEVLRDLEAVIYEKWFTQYGGLQFSKEVQYLADFCSTHTSVPIHGRFARIRQVAQVLSFDKVCVSSQGCIQHISVMLLCFCNSQRTFWRLWGTKRSRGSCLSRTRVHC